MQNVAKDFGKLAAGAANQSPAQHISDTSQGTIAAEGPGAKGLSHGAAMQAMTTRWRSWDKNGLLDVGGVGNIQGVYPS